MKLLIACDPNGGIGYKKKLPWTNLRGDLQRFKQLTENQVIVMGRHTWESLPKKPLPGRLNIVVTSSTLLLPNGAISVPNVYTIAPFNNAWIIGGAKLINSCWDLILEIHLTKTFIEYKCDTRIDMSYIEQHFFCEEAVGNDDHTYEIWKRK